jgi:hypothetical protein
MPAWIGVVAGLIGLFSLVQFVFRPPWTPSTSRTVPTTAATAHRQVVQPRASMKTNRNFAGALG